MLDVEEGRGGTTEVHAGGWPGVGRDSLAVDEGKGAGGGSPEDGDEREPAGNVGVGKEAEASESAWEVGRVALEGKVRAGIQFNATGVS